MFMADKYSTVYMYHIFIHSFVHRHVGCFHVFGVVNSAPMNIKVHLSFVNYSFVQLYAQEWDC